MIYGKTLVQSFRRKFESIQYNVALAITEATRAASGDKNYPKLGLESLQDRC